MADTAQKLLTVEEYLAITAELDDDMKWELIDGVMTPKPVHAQELAGEKSMAPERRRHARVKTLTGFALDRAIRAAGVPCQVLIDGIGVAIGPRNSFIPDVIVECGPLDPDALLSQSPVIIVEVLSPSTRVKDVTRKLVGYFNSSPVEHYLIVDPFALDVQHHRRSPQGIVYETHTGGPLRLDPPGLAVDLAAFFDD